MVFYICARCGQCGKPCEDNCLYTSDFAKSKLRHDTIKPVKDVNFIFTVQGNWIQLDEDGKVRAPYKMIPKPYRILSASYDEILQTETMHALKRDKKKEKDGKLIIL